MIYQLSTQQYPSAKALLGKFSDYPVVNALLEGSTPGRVYADHYSQSKSAFALTNAGFSYLLGSPGNKHFNQKLKERLEHEIFPAIRTSDEPTLIFYPLADGWETPIKEILSEYKVYDLYRKQFSFDSGKFTPLGDWRDLLPAGFMLYPINQSLLGAVGVDMFPWASPLAFLEKGFGFWVILGDEIACECSSVFTCGQAVEINILTEERYQRQGLARIAASAFIEECLARKLCPNWECWWDNQPSIALALNLGYEPINDHAVFLVELN